MEFLGVKTDGFSRLDIFKCEMDKDGHVIFCGDHGDGKTDALQSVMSVLSGEEYKSIDHPITKGKKRMEISVELKVEPGDEITLMDHIFRANVGDNITVALVKTLAGTPKLTLFNSTTGDQYKGTTKETRKISDRFLGRFPDPYKLDKLGSSNKRSEREEFLKIVAEMSKTKEGELIDFSPFIEQLETLRVEHSTQKTHLALLKNDLSLMPKPQDDWKTEKIEQESVSGEIQRFNDHETKNKERLQTTQEADKKLSDQKTILTGLEDQKTTLSDSINQLTTELITEKNSIGNVERMIIKYQENNPIVKPENTEVLTQQIEELQKKLKVANDLKEKNQVIEKNISDQKNQVVTRKEVSKESEKAIAEKQTSLDELTGKAKQLSITIIPSTEKLVDDIKEKNKPLPWTGKKDPEGLLEPLPFLNKLMSDAKLANKQVEDRETYEAQEKKIESTEKQMKDATDSANQVKEDERMVIESSVFPHSGIQIRRDDKDKVDVWVKDKHGVWNTYNDTNHAERLFQAVNIVTHGAGGDLKLLFVNEGYALLPYKRKQIIEAANRKGFKVMMEAFTAEEDENAIYLGEIESTKKIVWNETDPNISDQGVVDGLKKSTPAFGSTTRQEL